MLTENMQLNVVLTPINDKVIIVKNSSGNAYLPDWDYNGIGDRQVGQGYYIKTNQSTSLEICGEYQLPEENSIELNAGWNIIGYLRLEPANIADVFGEITDNDNLIVAKDYTGNAYLPEWNYNGIGDIIPGEGYQIKVVVSDSLHFLPNYQDY